MIRAPDAFVAPPELMRAAFSTMSPDEIVFVAQQCLEAGAWDHAIALCDALAAESDSPAIALCRAIATFVGGDASAALALVDRVLERAPAHLPALAVRAEMLLRTNRPSEAKDTLIRVLERYPDYPRASGLLATLLMPGPHYREVLARVHERLRPRVYLEIGVDTGATLALARFAELAIGIDPTSYPIRHRLPAGTRLFHEESDAFFAAHARAEVLGARRVDLAFIDGMHRFENALSDFTNVERWCRPDSTVVIHDCVPAFPRAAARERSTKFWVGDTWKLVLALRAYRPDLELRTLL
ncbi:MAG TPA: tetratricopeptide repeat protein, partial [Polyangiaceae bacterium]|nr:tetratricopeptide repeat protein [Polyangiaceae bacterium]